jgi:PTH1 family peptidyl-tRNA hydrolase
MQMKLLIGLGNPSDKYVLTRHNAGFMFVDYVYEHNEIIKPWKFDKYVNAEVAEISNNNKTIILAKPQTFMNRSGETAVKLIIRNSVSPSDVYVAHDDLDIKLGEFKVSLGKGPKLHNGISSIEELWKTKEFWRIRIGIENRTEPISGETFVLSNFNKEDLSLLDNTFEKLTHTL